MNEILIHPNQLMSKILYEFSLRNSGKLAEQAVFLPETLWDSKKKIDMKVEWVTVRDELDIVCAVPLIVGPK
jgi:hypothetical protein